MTRKLKNDSGEAPPSYDCAVIGAGPAGLTGALYLARFRRAVVVFDGGPSRAHWIPESHNCPGFPGGISGDRLLERLRAQLSGYGARMCATRIESLARHEGDSALSTPTDTRSIEACQVCGGTVKVIASIEDPVLIKRILDYLDNQAKPSATGLLNHGHYPKATERPTERHSCP